jgi:hypothetical protein
LIDDRVQVLGRLVILVALVFRLSWALLGYSSWVFRWCRVRVVRFVSSVVEFGKVVVRVQVLEDKGFLIGELASVVLFLIVSMNFIQINGYGD